MSAPTGKVVWLTGVPATGKTTVARGLVAGLQAQGLCTLWLDSDDLRRVLTPHPTYEAGERDAFYAAVGHIAALGAAGGVHVVVSATAPRRAYRDAVRAQVPCFVEVHLRCEAAALRQRDIKGLYARSDAGTISSLPGQGSAYEAPLRPELSFDTTTTPPAASVAAILRYVAECNIPAVTAGADPAAVRP